MPRRELLRRMAGAALGAGVLPARAGGPPPGLTDLMPGFWTAYDATRSRTASARVDVLIERFFAPHRADYERSGAAWTADGIARWLPHFDAIEPAVRRLHRAFPARLSSAADAFRATLADFDPVLSPVTVQLSLFKFDAHLEPAGGQLPLFFGLDGIVRLHGPDAHLAVLMSHELFHCYQAQRNPALSLKSPLTVGQALWLEGTATYASERLNSTEALSSVLFDDPALAGMSAGTIRQVARSILAQLDADDDVTVASYFDLGYRGAWPARAGYHVGLLAARAIGAGRSLEAMAGMPETQFRPALETALAGLARA